MPCAHTFDTTVKARPDEMMADFEADFASAAGVRNAADGQLVDATAQALAGDLWQGHRIHSPVQWLMWKGGLSRGTARRIITIAARSDQLPTTLGLLREGRLSLDQAHAVARYTPPEYEESVCKLARCATVAQIVAATRRYSFDVERPEPRAARERSVSFGTDNDGTWWARVRLAAEEGAVVERALQVARDRLHASAREDALARQGDRAPGVEPPSWADALVAMANSTLSSGCSDATARARRTVHIHLDRPHEGCGDEWIAELHGGAPLPGWLRQQLTCDADVEVMLTRDSAPVGATRSRRTPPDWLRRMVEKRDRYGCRVPGCDSTLWLQLHHIIHWEHGGETCSENLVCLCGKHHRMHHQGHLGITGDPDRPNGEPGALEFTSEHGMVMTTGMPGAPGPSRSRPDLPDSPRAHRYVSPTGERLQKRWVHFNRTHPPGERPPAA